MSVVRPNNPDPKRGAKIIQFAPRREKSRVSDTGFLLTGPSLYEEDPYQTDIELAETTINHHTRFEFFEDELPYQDKFPAWKTNLLLYGMAIFLGIIAPLLIFRPPVVEEVHSSFEQQVLERMDRAQQVLEIWALQDMRSDR